MATILIETKPMVTSGSFNMDTLHVKIDGELSDLVGALVSVLKEHGEAGGIFHTALMKYHIDHGLIDTWIKAIQDGYDLWKAMKLPGDPDD